jgi:hypothetical protein
MDFSQSCIVVLCKIITEKIKDAMKYLFSSKIIMTQPLHHWQSQETKLRSVLISCYLESEIPADRGARSPSLSW